MRDGLALEYWGISCDKLFPVVKINVSISFQICILERLQESFPSNHVIGEVSAVGAASHNNTLLMIASMISLMKTKSDSFGRAQFNPLTFHNVIFKDSFPRLKLCFIGTYLIHFKFESWSFDLSTFDEACRLPCVVQLEHNCNIKSLSFITT